jgi:protein-S-isoprenylcysteine O-methyltransferase Ste14
MKALALKIPPVAQFLAVVAAMWAVAKYLPALSLEIPARRIFILLFFCLGGGVAIPGITAFRAAGTTVDPRCPEEASRLVVAGVYRYSRNPMYLGLLCLLMAWALYLSNLVAFAGLPVFVLGMNSLQIRSEEAALEERFGDDYSAYRQRVRRWI